MLEKVEIVIVVLLVILITLGTKTVQHQLKTIRVSIKDHRKG
jgi:Sec-independent protein translocase protein TatA